MRKKLSTAKNTYIATKDSWGGFVVIDDIVTYNKDETTPQDGVLFCVILSDIIQVAKFTEKENAWLLNPSRAGDKAARGDVQILGKLLAREGGGMPSEVAA